MTLLLRALLLVYTHPSNSNRLRRTARVFKRVERPAGHLQPAGHTPAGLLVGAVTLSVHLLHVLRQLRLLFERQHIFRLRSRLGECYLEVHL